MDIILKAHFDSFRDKQQLPPELELKDVKLFDNLELLNEWRNNLKGIKYTDEKGNLIRGAVDDILVKGNKLIVLDFKTRGFPLKEDTHLLYQNQLNIYNFLLRKNNFETEDYAYLLFFHPTKVTGKGNVVFHSDLIKMPISITAAEELIKQALECLAGEMPEKNECEWCSWVEICKF
ncbi:PD-(D/E)XK nuclease family protein [Candidatus Woesearchaeota archaeon]|nr:PD-(D/E)XK nuclease family protein [Candidatus Woesearchaeota archaeon]